MLSRIALVLAVGALAAMALSHLREREDEAALEREVAAGLDALREHLFKRQH
jgi:hypothetical protein